MKCRLEFLGAIAIALSSPLHAQEVMAPPPSASFAATAIDSGEGAQYTIGVLDTLQIDVFDIPDLSRTVQVDNGGLVAMPLIGQVPASGRTTSQLSQDIAAELREKYLKDPIVTVTVKDPASRKITVDGSVLQPGIYEIGPGTTLIQAVALAKGPDAVADTHHVTIVRATASGQIATVFDLADIRDGDAADPLVQSHDVVVVGVSGSRRFVRDYGSVFGLAGLFRP